MADTGPFWEGTPSLLHTDYPGLTHALEHLAAWIVNTERIELARYILAGLTVFIVSDIMHTALSLDLGDLIFLGLLVAIRAAISHFLSREVLQIKENPEL